MALILCDVDGTLVTGASSYGTTMQEAISQVYGAKVLVDLHNYHGSTDRLVMKDVLTKAGVTYNNASLDECLRLFGELFPDNPSDIQVIPGVLQTVPILQKSHILALLTGNVEFMARKKLRLFQTQDMFLENYFPFGAFGGTDPHESRANLIHLARKKAESYGWRGRDEHTFVIDDSQKGLAAALEARVVPIGITTGIYTRQQLRKTGTEHIVDDFRELPPLIARLCREYSL